MFLTTQRAEIRHSVDMRQAQVETPTENSKNRHTDIRPDHGLGTADQLSQNLEPCWKTVTAEQYATRFNCGHSFNIYH